jgi:hypothetical protein
VQLLLRRGAQVHPDHGVRLVEVLRDVGHGEALSLERALAVHPGHGVADEISSFLGGDPGRLSFAGHGVAPER